MGSSREEVIKVMDKAAVAFADRDGTSRAGPVRVDFDRLVAADTLISDPPAVISPTLGMLGWLDERLDWVKRILPFTPNPLLAASYQPIPTAPNSAAASDC